MFSSYLQYIINHITVEKEPSTPTSNLKLQALAFSRFSSSLPGDFPKVTNIKIPEYKIQLEITENTI